MIEVVYPFLNDLFVALVTLVIVSFTTYAIKKYNDNKIERKYQITGKYITTYEDIIDDKKVECTAIAELKQKGKKVTGRTCYKDQSWTIEAEITENGILHGIYRADNVWDQGEGNLYLFINRNKGMDGLWSGFDNENKIITSGKYKFRPILTDYHIIDLNQSHFPQILNLANKELGENYLTPNDLSQFLTDMSSKKSVCKVAIKNKKVIGFVLTRILTKEELIEYLKVDERYIPSYLPVVSHIWFIKTVAVHKNYKRMGIAYSLIKTIEDDIRKTDITVICAIAWKNGDKINVDGILSSMGLEKFVEIKEYWKVDSIEKGYQCPNCGNPCCCSAVLYFYSGCLD